MFTTLSAEDLALDVGFSETVELARDAGFDAVDLPMDELVGWDPSRVSETLAAAGLRPGGWWLPVEWREARETYDAEMEKPVARAQSRGGRCALVQHVDLAVLGSSRLPPNFELHVERLKPVAALLGERGCVLGLEFVGPKTMRDDHPHDVHRHDARDVRADRSHRRAQRRGAARLLAVVHVARHAGGPRGTAPGPGHLRASQRAPEGLEPDEQIDDQRMLPAPPA